MVPLLLAAVLWHAPATIRVPNGEVRTLEIPASTGPARLVLRAHAAYWRPAGSNPLLRIRIDGREVGLMRDRRTARLAGERTRDRGLPRYDFGRWRVSQGPIATASDELALDVSDLLRPGQPTTLTLESAGAGALGATPVVVEDLRLETGETIETPPEALIDWRRPRLALPPPPDFQVEADRERVRVSWNGDTREVRTVVIGGPHQWERRIERFPTHVEVRDTVTNGGADVVGLRIRHAVTTDAAAVHLGGSLDPDVGDAYSPWNPTVFTPFGGAGGIGLVAEDDVFRQQLYVDFDAGDDTVGIRTDMLCLAPGESHTLVWSIYPVRTPSYWDFLNTLRNDWQVNHTVPGSFIWFTPEGILATPPDRLRDALARQHTAIAAMLGGWVDPSRTERPQLIGFGTAVLGDAFADYRDRIERAVRRLKEASPGLRVLLYFDAQRDSSPDAPRRFPDSVLRDAEGRPERVDWNGRYSTTWGMVPTAENAFGRAMGDVARAMRSLGGDGLYWDEMDGVDFRAPRLTTGTWDGRSCALGDDGAVHAKLGLVNLISEPVKLAYAGTGFVLGNVPPTTRRFMQRPDVRMAETHLSAFGPTAHLTTPLAYIGQRGDFAMVRERIDEGLLVAGARMDYEHDIVARMFPFTPEYIQPGTLRGRERIITTESGTHGWRRCAGDVRAFRYDAAGHEHVAEWRLKRRRGGAFLRVRLAPGEAAIVECEPVH